MAVTQILPGRSQLPPADYLEETRLLYSSLGYDSYRWAERTDDPPWSPIGKPLSGCTIMLIGSGGVYRRGQIAFHTRDDTSVRLIGADTEPDELRTAHFAYDQTDARQDPDCVYPLARLRELRDGGVIGGLTDDHCAFMGGIYSTRRLLAETSPLLVEQCRRQSPDVVLLVPV